MSPCGLVDHLESDIFKITPLHFGVKAYLFSLYENYHKGVGQKGLYEVGDVHYKKAESEVQKINHTNNEVQNQKSYTKS